MLLPDLGGGLTCPAFESMRKGADLLISQKPSDVRRRQACVGEILLRENSTHVFENSLECRALGRQSPSESSPVQTKGPCDDVDLGRAMGQERHDRVFHPRSDRTGRAGSLPERRLGVAEEKSVQKGIGVLYHDPRNAFR